MPRPIWNGVITFGMVSIPVGLYSAIQDKELHFNQLHSKCGSRIKLQKWCPVDEVVVENSDIVKGFEVSKGHYVILDEKDFEDLPVPAKHAIEVSAFVQINEVDPLYFDSSYYIEPTEAGRKPFALLRKALEEKGVAALAQIALRQKETMCLLRPTLQTLVLETLYYPDEIRKPETTKLIDAQIDPKELKMAESLVDLLAAPFEPENYRDEYREALMQRIEAKAQGQEVRAQPEAPPSKVIDLMDALKASLEAAKQQKRKSS